MNENNESASRAMLPVTDSQLTDEQEERIRQLAVLTGVSDGRAIIDGRLMVSHGEGDKEIMAFARAVLASPVAGWVSVEERLPGQQGFDSEQVLVFLNGHCGLHDMACRRGGGWGSRLGFFDAEKQVFRVGGSVELDVTHWAALPPAPVATPTQQEQSND